VENDLFSYTLDAKSGRGKMWQILGDEMPLIIEELNEALPGITLKGCND
jgi:hypothetical protein